MIKSILNSIYFLQNTLKKPKGNNRKMKKILTINEILELTNSKKIFLGYNNVIFKNKIDPSEILSLDYILLNEFFNNALEPTNRNGLNTTTLQLHIITSLFLYSFTRFIIWNYIINFLNKHLLRKKLTIVPNTITPVIIRESLTSEYTNLYMEIEFAKNFRNKGLVIINNEIKINDESKQMTVLIFNTTKNPIVVNNAENLFSTRLFWK